MTNNNNDTLPSIVTSNADAEQEQHIKQQLPQPATYDSYISFTTTATGEDPTTLI